MFNTLKPAPPDAILGLTEAFLADPNPHKVNLSVGQYKDESGITPILDCVHQAEQQLLEKENTKGYLPIDGDAAYGQCVQRLLFGAGHDVIEQKRAATVQTPGGTGALRVAADFVRGDLGGHQIWLSRPTWANHPNVFGAAQLEPAHYAYYDVDTRGLDFESLKTDLEKIAAGQVVVLHGCCHNPTGVDPTGDQWREIAQIVADRQLLPLVDFAYQGLATSLEDDAVGLRALVERVPDMVVCSSFSKNFGLYRERVGAMTVISASADVTSTVLSRVKKRVRGNYSNPPYHGAAIVATVLGDSNLRAQWNDELDVMRDRINDIRGVFAKKMQQLVPSHDFSFISRQRGMFSFSGLGPDQVRELREKHSIYIVGDGRINVAGLNQANVGHVCEAVASVLA